MPYQLVTCGLLGEKLCEYIQSTHHDLIQSQFVESLKQEHLEGKNAIAGFYQFNGLDLSRIKWIHSFGAGVDNYLSHPTLRSDTIITRTLGFMDKRIGEFCLAYILADLKHLFPTYESQKNKQWNKTNLNALYDKKVLVLGTGFIGKGVANAFSGLVSKVDGLSSSGTYKSPFHKVFSSSGPPDYSAYNIVINALPLTKNTSNFFDSNFFSRLNGALFINVGRGKSLVETDLIEALDKGLVRKAILDVFQKEPLPATSPLWHHPNAVITPHQSGLTTFKDLRMSFDSVIDAFHRNTRNELFVDLQKGY